MERRADLQNVCVTMVRGSLHLLGVMALLVAEPAAAVRSAFTTCACWSLDGLSAQLSQCLKFSENCCTVLYLSTKLLSLHHLKNIQLYISSEIFLLYTSH